MLFSSPHYVRREKERINPLLKGAVIFFSVFALLLAGVGIYSFLGANRIMRYSTPGLDNFPNNILPAFRNAYFTSLDGLTDLNGWYFASSKEPVTTVIMVHGSGSNRLQYGTDTVDIYDFFLGQGMNVLSFDLRHSGESSGKISAYGYSEWQDVIGAISYVKKVSSTTDVILYGFGSGVSACLLAMENLPPKGGSSEDYAYNIQVLGFDRGYVRGLILDYPLSSPDEYIRSVCRSDLPLGKLIGQYTVPYAVKLSAGNERKYNLAAILTRVQVPVHILYGNYSDASCKESARMLADERLRMFPNQTTRYYIGEGLEGGISALSGELRDTGYLESIKTYLNRFVLLIP